MSVQGYSVIQEHGSDKKRKFNRNCTKNTIGYAPKLFQKPVREAATICPAPVTLTFDLLTLKVVSESHVTWATYVPILLFLGLSVLDLGPMYAIDRRQSRQTASSLKGGGIIMWLEEPQVSLG